MDFLWNITPIIIQLLAIFLTNLSFKNSDFGNKI